MKKCFYTFADIYAIMPIIFKPHKFWDRALPVNKFSGTKTK
jgi:hypothetical protein